MADARVVLPLRNGLQLTVTGEPTLRALANFLKAGIIHFRNQRDIQKLELYTAGSFQGRAGGGDCAVSHPGDRAGQYLPPAAWADAVSDAHSRIESLEAMRREIQTNGSAGGADGRVTALLEQSSRATDLAALGIALNEPLH